MADYRFRKIDSEELEILIPLMKDCFGMAVNIDYFIWKYVDNPNGSFVGFIAEEKQTGEIAAYYGVIAEKYNIAGCQKTIFQSCDTMTHSRHRRKGLFQKLAIECYEYLRKEESLFVVGFGGGQSTPGFLKLGWRHVFNFRHYFKPALLCCFDLLRSQISCVFEITDIGQLEPLVSDHEYHDKIHSVRDIIHMKWRFSNPQYHHRLFVYSEGDHLEGFVCFSIQGDKLILLDFVFRSPQSRKALIVSLSKLVFADKLKGVVAFCQERGYSAKHLLLSGFIINPFNKGPLSRKTPFIFYADEEIMNRFSNESFWIINSYDHDSW